VPAYDKYGGAASSIGTYLPRVAQLGLSRRSGGRRFRGRHGARSIRQGLHGSPLATFSPGSAWFGILREMASRPFARRSVSITIPSCCTIPSAGPPIRRMSLRSRSPAAVLQSVREIRFARDRPDGDPFPGTHLFPVGAPTSAFRATCRHFGDDVEFQLPTADCRKLGGQSELRG